ncbi:5410_t:CDS:2 [Diversispora eburnea]|uniref:5410_t:CDS:1 n=1 Tax=Diversispora eburnea TaxID=1213867 RepID=A0A9N9C540_9GLOM|nr:5410_t:CDS:2 [Diversispora eburnea]
MYLTLEEIDNAKFGWFHIRTCIVAGVGFFADAYDLFAINIVSVMLGYVYFNGSSLPSSIDISIKVSAPVGTFVGQFAFGILADHYGRKKMYGIELMIIIVATMASALAASSYVVSFNGVLIFWRIILGIGIGGDYPLSAIITSEYATTKRRGSMVAAVFAMQGFGILSAAIVSVITLACFKSSILDNSTNIDYVWRIVLGMGAVPGVVALYFRLTIPETPRYTMDIELNIDQAAKDITDVLETGAYEDRDNSKPIVRVDAPKASLSDFKNYFSKWENGKILLGTSMTWFLLDVAFYGIGLNNTFILEKIGYGKGTPFQTLWNISIGNIIINLLGTVPGYWFTVALVDSWGRKPIQLMGFSILTALFIVLGFGFNQIKDKSIPLFIVIFTLIQFFMNFGPNATTFIVPGEVFPTRYRSTGHGISAASGKLGAIIAQVGFGALKDRGGEKGSNAFLPHLLQIFAAFMFAGLLFTFLIPETKGKTLEELSNEDQNDFVRKKRDKSSIEI